MMRRMAGRFTKCRFVIYCVAVFSGIGSVVAAICFTGCAWGPSVPRSFSSRALTACEAPPGSLIRTTRDMWIEPGGWTSETKASTDARFLARGTTLKVVSLTELPGGWTLPVRVAAEMVVVEGPGKGTAFTSNGIFGKQDAGKTGFRYFVFPHRAQLVSRSPETGSST
jgi:hypothetical protein